jgi:WD40 repeat protein
MTLSTYAQYYQGINMPFGKNRVQYKEFLWSYYRYERYDIYFNEGGRNNAIYLSQVIKEHYDKLESSFDYFINDRLEFIIYNTHSDFKQSNIGISSDQSTNIGGNTRIVGSKVFMYFDGDHAKFEKQIRAGISQIIINQMMYGGNWKEVLKNSVLLTVPDWYLNGLISYMADPDDQYVYNRSKDAIMAGKYEKFNRLTGEEAKIAGHSLWRFIADVYGENIIPNVLYMTRMSRNVETGFLYVLGISFKDLSQQYSDYYRGIFNNDTSKRLAPFAEKQKVKTKKKRVYQHFKLSPDGIHAAYVSNEMGQYRVFIYDRMTGKRKKIFKAEHKLERVPDLSYPPLAWHPTGDFLSFIIEKKDKRWLMMYDLKKKKITKKPVFLLEKVLDLNYSPDGQKIVFSGVKDGQSDIYVYYVIGNRQEQLTNDIYDDLNPRFADGDKKIVFTSNRTSDTIRTRVKIAPLSKNKDVFAYDFLRHSKILERITNTPEIDENSPHGYGSGAYTFLSNENGIINRFWGIYDSTISHIDTTVHYRYFTNSYALSNVSRDIEYYDYEPFNREYSMVTYECGKFKFYIGNKTDDEPFNTSMLPYSTLKESQKVTDAINSIDMSILDVIPSKTQKNIEKKNKKEDGVNILNTGDVSYTKDIIRIDEYLELKTVVTVGSSDSTVVADAKPIKIKLPSQRNYNVNFATDYVITQIDNSFNSQFYQSFIGPENVMPGFSFYIKYGMSDLFEDYRLVGGFRFGANLRNNNYMLYYENLKKRLDKKIIFERQVEEGTDGFSLVKLKTNQIAYEVRYPLSEIDRFEARVFYRNDNYTFLATDFINLTQPDFYVNTFGVKLAYVFDNTISRGLNLYNGWRFKIWGEFYYEPDPQATNLNPLQSGSEITIFGLDARHYLKIHRDLILAMRFGANTSLGSRKLIHYLGGVDSWLFGRKVDNSTPIDFNQNFYFQTLAVPIRGFFINARNGSSMAVANLELRWPIFKYFFNSPIKSDFVKNFQLVGFYDIGSAWNGPHPYHEDNTFNQQIIEHNPLTIIIDSNREPIIYGYGFGLRSRILGYFVRADWAWGVDDGLTLPSVFYFSLSLDF